jgi:hypothetical protein
MVRTAGLEPAQGFPQGILSPLRLPFRHVRGCGQLYTSADADNYTRPRMRTTTHARGCGQLYTSADADNYTCPRMRTTIHVRDCGQLHDARGVEQLQVSSIADKHTMSVKALRREALYSANGLTAIALIARAVSSSLKHFAWTEKLSAPNQQAPAVRRPTDQRLSDRGSSWLPPCNLRRSVFAVPLLRG